MDWNEKVDLKKVKNYIIDRYKILSACGVFLIIGMVSLISTLGKIETENNNICLAVQKWYAQLPEEHWIKNEDNKYFEQNFFDNQIMDLYEQLKSYSYTFFKLSNVAMSQEGKAGLFFAKAMEVVDYCNEKEYCLKNSEGKTINNIKLKVGEDFTVFFYCGEAKMLLDFSEEEYINEISHFESNTFSLANRIVFSYSDNPEIATIFNGRITGVSRGKTTIHFVCNGYFFSYEIRVK